MARQTIGRAEECDIRINDLSVSRNHAEIEKLGANRFVLRDLDSTYGTRVFRDGEWVEILEIEVKQDTPLRIGDHETTVATLMGQSMDDAIETAARAAGPAAGKGGHADQPPATGESPAPKQKVEAEKEAPAASPAATPEPKGLAKRVKDSRTGGGDGDKSTGKRSNTLWYVVGGAALIVLVAAATAAVLYFRDQGPSSAEIQAELDATCRARGATPARCACIVGFIMKRGGRREQEVILFNWQNQSDPDRVRAYLQENFTPDQRAELRGSVTRIILGAEAQCSGVE